MSNSYFQFKKFTIHQDKTAMKVGTLACIFGAAIETDNPRSILDIGTGTGLLSLMMAQRFPGSEIDALEIEEKAFHQARSNFIESPWKERLHIECVDFINWKPSCRYDLVITNPPFFSDHLKSPKKEINLARHDDQLPMKKLIAGVYNLLNENGDFWMLLPKHESDRFVVEARQAGLFLNFQMFVLNFEKQPPKAVISKFSKQNKFDKSEDLVIWLDKNTYSDKFVELLKEFYLHL